MRRESKIDFVKQNIKIFPENEPEDIQNLIECLAIQDEFLSTVKSPKRTVTIPAKQRIVALICIPWRQKRLSFFNHMRVILWPQA